MKRFALAPLAFAVALVGCSSTDTANTDPASAAPQTAAVTADNPFFKPYNTEFGIAPFEKIRDEHFMPAFEAGISEAKADIERIANQKAAPTFANTIEALETSGKLLAKVSDVFYNLTGSNSNDTLRKIQGEIAPRLSALRDDMRLNDALFKRVKTVYDQRAKYNLDTAQTKLLTDSYRNFVRGGANLNPEQKAKLRDLNGQLSKLSIDFGNNLLAETNAFQLVIDNKKDLAGLPAGVVAAAAETAAKNGMPGKWIFTTQRPSFTPFMTYADNRETAPSNAARLFQSRQPGQRQ